ncbi:hypothetical protein DASC09_030350 [Saccharomycopsis crataegensis]|uniref:Uncharacterized protein n=1 Tax=Saccharomycopsis crataegensis TaxID=43959 RepID=A0AAV5QL71_9ASCO|nr:hypothetical protein DASC09_030350 [Saccharomycopsis crataegensis]
MKLSVPTRSSRATKSFIGTWIIVLGVALFYISTKLFFKGDVLNTISIMVNNQTLVHKHASWVEKLLLKFGYQRIPNPGPAQYARNLGFDVHQFSQLSKENYYDKLPPIDFKNASAVFNSVNSVLDGPAGTIQPNGVSVFTGYIPAGTLFYHAGFGGETGFPPSPEWVAINWEYSYDFGAHGEEIHRPGEPNRRGPGHGKRPLNDSYGMPPPPPHPQALKDEIQAKFGIDDGQIHRSRLLTFTNIKPLNKLIVMEGASAKKDDDGTMDVHNVLARENFTYFYGGAERSLAKSICDWGKIKYGGLDGIVRMEVGFEIIFCDFESEKIQLVSNDTFMNDLEILGFPSPLPLNESLSEIDNGDQNQELVDDDNRYKLIKYLPHFRAWGNFERHFEPESRIKIDYRGFTTILNQTFMDPDTYKRRLRDTPIEVRENFVGRMEHLFAVNQEHINYWDGTDWKKFTNHIVSKFYPVLDLMNSTYTNYLKNEDISLFGVNLTMYTYHIYKRYQDSSIHDVSLREKKGIEHAVWEYSLPNKPLQSEGDILIWTSVAKVIEMIVQEVFEQYRLSHKIVNSQFNSLKVDRVQLSKEIKAGFIRLNNLIDDLDWTIATNCREKCPNGTVCYIPTWGPSPLWGFDRSDPGKEFKNGALRIKQECQCMDVSDIWKFPEFKV